MWIFDYTGTGEGGQCPNPALFKGQVSIIDSIFTALKILCAFSIHPSLPLATTDLFTVTIILLFPDVIVRIIQFTAFLHWLLSLSEIVHLRVFFFLMSFNGLIVYFFLAHNISFSGCTTVYPFTYWRPSWLLPSFGNYE